MRGRHETPKPKGQMARRLVYYCIVVLSLTAVWAAVVKTIGACEGASVDLSDVLTFIGAAFGGELLLLCLKRLFAKDKPEECREEAEDAEEAAEG